MQNAIPGNRETVQALASQADAAIEFAGPHGRAGQRGRLRLTTMRELTLAEGWVLAIDRAPAEGARIRTVAEVKS